MDADTARQIVRAGGVVGVVAGVALAIAGIRAMLAEVPMIVCIRAPCVQPSVGMANVLGVIAIVMGVLLAAAHAALAMLKPWSQRVAMVSAILSVGTVVIWTMFTSTVDPAIPYKVLVVIFALPIVAFHAFVLMHPALRGTFGVKP